MKRALLLTLLVSAAVCFASLGIWQLERLAWKHALIDRVDARIHAEPVPVPAKGRWPGINAGTDEYRRVRLKGIFLHDRTTLVDALTDLGAGAWVMTPLQTDNEIVLVNRGFVPGTNLHDYSRPAGTVTLVGLLRMPESEGRFLRPNQPNLNRWFSRDVSAIGAARKLGAVAPFFVDAEKAGSSGYPTGGLTVVRFRDAHLAYALTWFCLAGIAAFGTWRLLRN